MSRSKLMNHLVHLRDEVNILQMRLKPSATGHLHTTIGVLEERIKEVEEELKKDEQNEESIGKFTRILYVTLVTKNTTNRSVLTTRYK